MSLKTQALLPLALILYNYVFEKSRTTQSSGLLKTKKQIQAKMVQAGLCLLCAKRAAL